MHLKVRRSSVVTRFSSEAVAIRLLWVTSTAARHNEVAQGPRDLELDVPPLRRRPLLLREVAAAAAAVLVAVLHH